MQVFTQSPVRGCRPRGIPNMGISAVLPPPLPTTAVGLSPTEAEEEPDINEVSET